ncbi:GDP-L-fucose synthase [Alcanivorax sp.]|uniref:GDP-L-fucose synthase family protein n=1 Tax=Alcanivorax sp. TaxID=1872427 RepID=UPI00258FC2A7|nr:GDP-L-fucose synthase [Alcanivorax sp.]
MNNDAKIFVAGHSGLVGSAIVRRLQKESYENLLLRTSSELDLRDQSAVDVFFVEEKPEYVFLAAAKVGGIHANNSSPADFIRDNLQIEVNVIDAAWRNGVKKLLFLGSSCIYPKMAPQPLKEEYLLTGPLEPTNEWYAIAKIAGIKMCQAYRRQYGFDAISLMPTNLYGPNDNFDLETSHVLPAMLRKFHLAKLVMQGDLDAIVRDEQRFGRIPNDVLAMLGLERTDGGFRRTGAEPKVVLWGTGSPRREFLHVDDLAAACLFLMQNYSDEQIVNAGVGKDVTIRDLAEMIRAVVGFDGEIVWDRSKPDGTPRKVLDVSRIERLGWCSRISLEEGLLANYLWYKKEVG